MLVRMCTAVSVEIVFLAHPLELYLHVIVFHVFLFAATKYYMRFKTTYC